MSGHELLSNSYIGYQLLATGSDYQKKSGVEDYHTLIENSVAKILDQLYELDLDFFKVQDDKSKFCFFIGMQYTRTKKTMDRMIKSFEIGPQAPENWKGKFDPKKIVKLIALLFAESIGNWMYSKANINILQNSSSLPFITGDQPSNYG